ncbi:SRPBCC family protein [Ketogulonicigenium vulgare]|uniref:DNA polymerase III subunits gamma and tau n=1 Tax=Ketogulonicigenium vulgare (strain WSH-001) TaxID=759362 RepID=F9YA91_KETVW|nr:SRPBCC family protein [Ketogulonicigenium vulgare]ADO42044.1 conserved hypothetical protein [Ketogulonicigenium vulgare Y25]AEM40264.1 DNA polymerase III subunits gamma and tau [Ketogulonicigenium vulgare WSH-001]ALJ80463.1 DNA polymerase III subunit gamma/tau [Ketogulonicigenium vulgare]ANW33291.1 DNA polymerase III subunit gamma/tau [Ketogulonicigenium vulgare]AOZ53971.1 hypothetical protein KVC_0954 [Ketogulonicigenium vulgare]
MEFVVNDHIAVSPDALFKHLNDTDLLEQMIRRGGATVRRTDAGRGAGVGATWQIGAPFRDRTLDVTMTVTEVEAPHRMRVLFTTGGVEGKVVLLATPAGDGTDTAFTMTMGASTLIGRLLLQSLKLARGQISSRVHKRVGNYLHRAEERAGV